MTSRRSSRPSGRKSNAPGRGRAGQPRSGKAAGSTSRNEQQRPEGGKSPRGRGPAQGTGRSGGIKFTRRSDREEEGFHAKPNRKSVMDGDEKKSFNKFQSERKFKKSGPGSKFSKPKNPNAPITDEVRLNKFIANTGLCSRREADQYIEDGLITINGKVITKLGTKVVPSDIVKYAGQELKRERLVYVLLNKPKDYVTTTKDPQDRKTVMQLVQKACKERIYPVGRLDRNTTGLLLFTNDGEMAKRLTHPSHEVKKVYHVHLDTKLKEADLQRLMEGVRLEDGVVKADVATYVGMGEDKKQIGLELHSGKNRVVRRMMEALGYHVLKLDRVLFAGLTKKDLPRGRWRYLTDKELNILRR